MDNLITNIIIIMLIAVAFGVRLHFSNQKEEKFATIFETTAWMFLSAIISAFLISSGSGISFDQLRPIAFSSLISYSFGINLSSIGKKYDCQVISALILMMVLFTLLSINTTSVSEWEFTRNISLIFGIDLVIELIVRVLRNEPNFIEKILQISFSVVPSILSLMASLLIYEESPLMILIFNIFTLIFLMFYSQLNKD